jgi:hypothetical protein
MVVQGKPFFLSLIEMSSSCFALSCRHKSGAVRRATSQFLVPVVERMGPGRVLSGIKDVTDKILPTAVNFLLDGSPETRLDTVLLLCDVVQLLIC